MTEWDPVDTRTMRAWTHRPPRLSPTQARSRVVAELQRARRHSVGIRWPVASLTTAIVLILLLLPAPPQPSPVPAGGTVATTLVLTLDTGTELVLTLSDPGESP